MVLYRTYNIRLFIVQRKIRYHHRLRAGPPVYTRLPLPPLRPTPTTDPVDGSAVVLDLPWVGELSDGKLWGTFSGPAVLLPHSEGSLVLEGDPSMTFRGRWADGRLVTPLLSDDSPPATTAAPAQASMVRRIRRRRRGRGTGRSTGR